MKMISSDFDEAGNAFYRRFDVAAFVARGNDDGGRTRLGRRLPQRTANRIMSQAQAADERQRRQEAVDQPAEPEQPHRQQHAPLVLDRFEVGERDQRAYVGGGEDVLRRLRHFQPDRLGQFQRRIPQVREIADDQPGLGHAQGVQALQHGLAVVERAERVDHHDDVERAGQGAHERRVLDVADQEREIGMRGARLRDHARAEIRPDAERRFERGEQVAAAAAELEHAGTGGNQKLEVAQILFVEEGRALQPLSALRRAGVGKPADIALARRHLSATAA